MKRVFSVLTVLGLVLGFSASLISAQATLANVVVDDDGLAAPGNCNALTAAPATIQGGVNAAVSGNTVQVCPGTYNENVVVNKTLTIQGAKAGVDARTRATANESIVTGTDGTGAIQLLADNIRLNGFDCDGQRERPGDLHVAVVLRLQAPEQHRGEQRVRDLSPQRRCLAGLGSREPDPEQQRDRRGQRQRHLLRPGCRERRDRREQVRRPSERRRVVRGPAHSERDPQHHHQDQQQPQRRHLRGLFSTVNAEVRQNHVNDTVFQDASSIFVGGDSNGILIDSNVITNPGYAGIAVRRRPGHRIRRTSTS